MRRLVLVHGHGHKPPAGELENLWRMALGHALERDHGRKLAKLSGVRVSLAYYGDLTRGPRPRDRAHLDEELDVADRYTAFRELSARASKKEFRSHHYHRMRGRSSRGASRSRTDATRTSSRCAGSWTRWRATRRC